MELWAWFLECLKGDMETIDGKGWTFMLDQQKVPIFYFFKLRFNASMSTCFNGCLYNIYEYVCY